MLFLENLVEVLARYDHTKYFYTGENSEGVLSNVELSFEMAFGGAGYALSYPLAVALAKNIDACIERQIDLLGDISGYLSALPQFPFISLHHLDAIDPLFPSMNRSESHPPHESSQG
ncbi:hypothetical protein Ancab_007332 [Ancistrocladus abbreviatus]